LDSKPEAIHDRRHEGGNDDGAQPSVVQLDEFSSMTSTSMWPFALYAALVLIVAGGIIGVSHFLGERHHEVNTYAPYEGGVVSTGSARVRFSSRFYLVAMFFVVFDLESVFLYAWAVSARAAGWPGFIEVTVFVAVLLAALVYLVRLGGLDFGPGTHVSRKW
jgi:NADH-quinone oxidoreductase subunit A